MQNKKIYKILLITGLVIFSISQLNAQEDTARGTYIPYGQEENATRRDTVVMVKKPREKPGTVIGNILHYLSPIKYDIKDSIYPLYTEEDPFFLHESNHVIEDQRNKYDSAYSEKYWTRKYRLNDEPKAYKKDTTIVFSKEVYGYHPYWMGTAYQNYNFSLLTRIAYFSYHLNPTNGHFIGTNYWINTKIVDYAHKYGCKVDLCVTNFGTRNNKIFLENKKAQETLISNLIQALKLKKGDGINVNFEAVPKTQKDNFTEFVKSLSERLKRYNPQYKITMTIPAIDWRNAYDVGALKDYVDFFFVMGYDLYGKYSKVAGPNALLFSGADWTGNNINTTINGYIELGAPSEKLLLGLPYYGNEWITESGEVPSKAKKYVGPRTYSFINTNYADKYLARYDSTSHSIYYIFRDSIHWRQCWFDNEQTLGLKYDYINEKNLGGLGIWALGYDNNFSELWSLIKRKFTQPIDTSMDFHTRLAQTLEQSVSKKTISEINKKDPEYTDRITDTLGKSWRVFTLLFAIIMIFAIIGFVVAVTDFDVRFVLFNKEVRTYLFFILIALLTLLILRVLNILQNYDVVLVLAIVFGISAALIILNVGNVKKTKAEEEKP